MKKKILFVAHMDSHIANFHLPYLKWFQDHGYETHVASNNLEKTQEILYCDVKHQISFKRSPFSLRNISVYKTFKKLIETHQFELIHAHTPMGGLISRLALRKSKAAVFYTAHGFHFYKGGSRLSWLLFYPMERFLSRYTNELITINQEDYTLAKNKFSKKTHIAFIPGVGVDLDIFKSLDKNRLIELKRELDVYDSDFVMVYVAEQTKGKNQKFLIDFVNTYKDKYNNLKLIFVGYGKMDKVYQNYINQLSLNQHILQLGYRKDVVELTNLADLIVSVSLREGLPKAVLEALSIGKPLLVSNIRGNRDLVTHNQNGFIFKTNDLTDFENYFSKLYLDQKLREQFSKTSQTMSKTYSIEQVIEQVSYLYKKYL